MKTLRTYLAESLGDADPVETLGPVVRSRIVGEHVAAVRDWLAQPEILGVIVGGLVESGTVEGAALALRREAVK